MRSDVAKGEVRNIEPLLVHLPSEDDARTWPAEATGWVEYPKEAAEAADTSSSLTGPGGHERPRTPGCPLGHLPEAIPRSCRCD
ncbi:hypothetical protein G3M48_009005 [Beauveria asiatica]|uniref:Uncharacterized protein n=1 Tax=Beauveria asiatica TaxID=1069075 RepID=A0AAW0RJS5_9HYPO